jgi:DNA segregation ATPase FtsK/SpoIIIE-like protein
MIDEFQEFFSEDDKLGQEAGLLLDRLVRQGRAFGIHVLLGSQTIGGSGLARSTIGQMAVRVALQTSEADSQLILGDNNSAARLLSRPGEAIYNDAGGSVEGNSPFQVSWLPDETRERYLTQVTDLARRRNRNDEPPIVVEGNAPADAAKNPRLAELLASPAGGTKSTGGAVAWLGEPVAIKEPTGVLLRRQSGANVLLVGQQEEAAMGILANAVVGLAAQQPPDAAQFYVLDGSPADSPLAAVFPRVKDAIPHEVKLIQWRGVEEAVNELAEEMQRRRDGEQAGTAPSVYFLVYGLQRYRVLRKGEEEFSFSMSSSGDDADAPKKPNPGKQFADLLREGPPVGIHVLVWCDTPIALERTLDRTSMREFDHRVLFQMSAADSSNLIDSPAANKLGFYRALSYSEEQGVMEKFRPYALPGQAWLDYVNTQLGKMNSPQMDTDERR